MTLYLRYALLVGLCGAELFFLLRHTHERPSEEKALTEAAEYRIIDATPSADEL
jgi:hypothetical protein